ncbi:MAG: siroheme synthase CysG [Proteobacteria bacterium]|nr:siroheme synthase CysG [Pseudomonadota bacterium]
MDYLPINIDIKNKKCVVFGAGVVAFRKIQMLNKAGAEVTCVAKNIHKDIQNISEKIELIEQEIVNYLNYTDLKNITLIISATADRKISEYIYQRAIKLNILINTVDDKQLCSYISPAIVNRNPVVVSISSSGSAPVLARKIRESIEKLLPHNIGKLALFSEGLRSKVKSSLSSMSERKHFWENFLNSSVSSRIINTGFKPDSNDVIKQFSVKSKQEGEVYLVGAGPGDPELLTIKALRVMQQADVVLHDNLISQEILELVRRDAELINVGKSMGNHRVEQVDINQLLIDHALKGKRVCRLKGGDPFVFGRGGEEIQALRKAQINYQIVPGITAAVGCTSYAGIPLTHRDYAQRVVFLTAHCKNSIDTLDWSSLVQAKQTLVVYMGLMKSQFLVDKLIANGQNKMTPVAIIENGTCQNQRVITGNLNELTGLIKDNKVNSPALLVIGEVAQLANELAWFYPENHIEPIEVYS